MATLTEKAALRSSEALRNRLAACIADEAYQIVTLGADVRHDVNATAWATGMLRSWSACTAQADAWMHRLTLNASVAASGDAAPDSDILFVLRNEIIAAEIAVEA